MDTLFSYIMCCFFTKCQNYSQTDQHPCPREVGVAQVFASFYDPFNAWDDILLFLHHLMFIRIPTGTDNMAVTWPCLLVHWQYLALIWLADSTKLYQFKQFEFYSPLQICPLSVNMDYILFCIKEVRNHILTETIISVSINISYKL